MYKYYGAMSIEKNPKETEDISLQYTKEIWAADNTDLTETQAKLYLGLTRPIGQQKEMITLPTQVLFF